ncbi:MAG: hypothetical protein EPO09_15560, partial [Aquabacterium sp.]
MGDATTWSKHIVDDSGSTMDLKYTNTVTTVSNDGSFVRSLSTVGGQVPLLHGTDYTVDEVDNYANGGVLNSVTSQLPNRTCTFSVAPQAVPVPISAGMKWSKQWSKTCTDGFSANVALTQGQWVAKEQVTVGLGTFMANKVHYMT